MYQLAVKDKAAFMELQKKHIKTTQEITQINTKLRQFDQTKRSSTLTLQELQEIDVDTKTYMTVGRMFVVAPKTEIETLLKGDIASCESSTKDLLDKGNYLTTQLKEIEENIKELTIKPGEDEDT